MTKYLSGTEVFSLHGLIIEESGGLYGLRDLKALISCVTCPQMMFDGKDLYPSLAEKAAALLFFLAKNHPFNDGNKRTAVMSSILFLKMNDLVVKNPLKIEDLVLEVACNRKTLKDCFDCFEEACSDGL